FNAGTASGSTMADTYAPTPRERASMNTTSSGMTRNSVRNTSATAINAQRTAGGSESLGAGEGLLVERERTYPAINHPASRRVVQPCSALMASSSVNDSSSMTSAIAVAPG